MNTQHIDDNPLTWSVEAALRFSSESPLLHWPDVPAPATAGSAGRGTTPVNTSSPDIAMTDWEDLFTAVTDRLRHLSDDLSDRPLNDAAGRAQIGVIDCVSALEQLHSSLAHGLGRQRQLEREARELTAALARAHADLAGTQAGELRAQHLALHDSLTSLPNRTHFRERLGAALSRAARSGSTLAVLYLDLDGFKPINDEHGHDVGDELLRAVAMRMVRSVRAADMVGRLGGDEFGCLIADPMDRDRLQHIAGKLFDAVSAPVRIGTLTVTVRPSVGVAVFPVDGDNVDLLLKRADAAMYFAKRQQTRHAFFDACALQVSSAKAS